MRAELHLVNLLSATHAWWARLTLGSRAPHIVPGAPLDDLPLSPESDPDQPSDLPLPTASFLASTVKPGRSNVDGKPCS